MQRRQNFYKLGSLCLSPAPGLCGDTPVVTNDLTLLLFIIYRTIIAFSLKFIWNIIFGYNNYQIHVVGYGRQNICSSCNFYFYIPTFSQHQMHHTNKRNFILSQISHIQKINFLVLQIYFPHKSGKCWLVFFNSNIINVNSHTQYPCLA